MKAKKTRVSRYDGHVLSVHNESFWVCMGNGVNEYEAEIMYDKISKKDRAFIRPGAYFKWVIRGEDQRIRFIRFKPISEKDIQKAKREASWLCIDWGVKTK